MVKIAILSPKNAKLVVDNPLFLAQIDDGSFANYALTMRGLKSLVENEKFIVAEYLMRLAVDY